jgi:hypothetical protein
MARSSSNTNDEQLQDVRKALNALDTAVGALSEGSGVHPAIETAVEPAGSTAASKAAERSAGPSNDSVSFSQLQELVSNQLANVILRDPGSANLLQLLAATSPYKDQSQDGYFPVLSVAVFGSAASSPSSGIQRFDRVQGGSDADTGDAGVGTADAGTSSSWGGFGATVEITGGLYFEAQPDGGFTWGVTTPGLKITGHGTP